MGEHTATPWRVNFEGTQPSLAVCGGVVHITAPTDAGAINDKANAAFIVRACNSHEQLVKALEAALPFIDDALDAQEFAQEIMPDIAASEECRQAVINARTALAAAKGEG